MPHAWISVAQQIGGWPVSCIDYWSNVSMWHRMKSCVAPGVELFKATATAFQENGSSPDWNCSLELLFGTGGDGDFFGYFTWSAGSHKLTQRVGAGAISGAAQRRDGAGITPYHTQP